MASEHVISNGAKLLGETFVTPGTSLLLDGNVTAGVVHGVLGLVATAFLGPVGPLARIALAVNSYSRSVNDRNLWDFRAPKAVSHPAPPPPAAAPAKP